MGKHIGTEAVLAILGIQDDEVHGTVTDPRESGNSGTVVLRGTVMMTIADMPNEPLSVTVHDHDSTDEAQACAQSMIEAWTHGLAESLAMADNPTVARSQVSGSLRELLEALGLPAANPPYPSGQYV